MMAGKEDPALNFLIVLASGKSTRLKVKGSLPKPFIKVGGKPLISYSLSVFMKLKEIDEVIVVLEKQYFPLMEKIYAGLKSRKPLHLVEGGKTRQGSSFNAVGYLNGRAGNDSVILIHDAARPLVAAADVISGIQALEEGYDAASLVSLIHDSIIETDREEGMSYLDRDKVFAVKTPQIFRYQVLLDAHLDADKKHKTATDDISLLNLRDRKIKLIPTSRPNIKITTIDDLLLFKGLLKEKNG